MTEEPNILETDYNRCFKHPFMACEALCSHNEKLIKNFLGVGGSGEGRRFVELFNVLKTGEFEDEINSTLMGYVSRVVESIILKFPDLVREALVASYSPIGYSGYLFWM